MRRDQPAQRRFLFLLSLLAAVLAVCALIIVKAFVEHAVFREALATVFIVVFGPFLWFFFEALVAAAFATGLGQIEIHFPKWVHKLMVAILVLLSLLLLVDVVFEFGWIV